MNLSKQIIGKIEARGVEIPASSYFDLPEKVLQFGTGVLLRGLPDYFIDKANKKGLFNGRIVVVKSTGSADTGPFEKQDGLYTLVVRGVEENKKVEEYIINASISRVLSAKNEWEKILQCAGNPQMNIIISNTTEVGIVLTKDNILASPPESFPGKLLAFLYERYKIFKADPEKGMVIIPTELLPDNGGRLLAILLELASQNGLEDAFAVWIKNKNNFCSSLVDRIVPGRLGPPQQEEAESFLGYSDELMIMAEVYRLWAIETSSEKVKKILSFSQADRGVIIAPDISLFRELKLRLLNGSHTLSCGLAWLAGFTVVKKAMEDPAFSSYIRTLMLEEIAPAITNNNLSMEAAVHFSGRTLERYNNPYIAHSWLGITLQYCSKMRMRVIPLLLNHFRRFETVPRRIALGFAAHLLFMKSEQGTDGLYYGEAGGKKYLVNDEFAAYYAKEWNSLDQNELVREVLKNEKLWGANLCTLPGFAEAVTESLQLLIKEGAGPALKNIQGVLN
jgi:tagaturonate reductase